MKVSELTKEQLEEINIVSVSGWGGNLLKKKITKEQIVEFYAERECEIEIKDYKSRTYVPKCDIDAYTEEELEEMCFDDFIGESDYRTGYYTVENVHSVLLKIDGYIIEGILLVDNNFKPYRKMVIDDKQKLIYAKNVNDTDYIITANVFNSIVGNCHIRFGIEGGSNVITTKEEEKAYAKTIEEMQNLINIYSGLCAKWGNRK